MLCSSTFHRVHRLNLFVLAFLVCVSAHAQRTTTPEDLARRIDAVLDAAAFEEAFWGVLVVDLETGQTIYTRNADKRFLPASNLKLITTAAALDGLGPDFRYTTGLYFDGEVRGTTLVGDLIIRGSGDPTLGSTRFGNDDPLGVFRRWADALKSRGVTRITGNVIGDDNVFDDVPYGLGWAWDDFVYDYGAETSGLTFHEGTINMTVRGTSPGSRAAVSWLPIQTDYIRIDNQSRTLTSGRSTHEGYARELSGNRFTITTEVAAGRRDTEALAIHNPTQYAAHMLRLVLLQEGIGVEGRAIDADDLPSPPSYLQLDRVASATSPLLAEIVEATNRKSINLFAEHLLRTLGVHRYHGSEAEPGSVEAGVRAMRSMLTEAGISEDELQMVDGSGLSFMNRVTPQALVALLSYMHTHSDSSVRTAFYDSLPLGGHSGTLSGRYPSGDARGNVRAKTGYINGVRTLSGYVTAASGNRLAFSILCNHYATRTSRVSEAQDDVVELLADFAGR